MGKLGTYIMLYISYIHLCIKMKLVSQVQDIFSYTYHKYLENKLGHACEYNLKYLKMYQSCLYLKP